MVRTDPPPSWAPALGGSRFARLRSRRRRQVGPTLRLIDLGLADAGFRRIVDLLLMGETAKAAELEVLLSLEE